MATAEALLAADDLEEDSLEKHGARIPFADAEIFFEFNSTDNDLGVQIFLDGEPWKKVVTLDPRGHKLFEIDARGRLRRLGITELFFESAEPSPGEVLELILPGEYRFLGRSLAGDRLVGEGTLSHDLPPPPVFTPTDGAVVDPANLVFEWQPIAALDGFQLIVVSEDTGASLTVDLPAEATSMPVPEEFLESGSEYKIEVLAIAENGNKTITEGVIFTMP